MSSLKAMGRKFVLTLSLVASATLISACDRSGDQKNEPVKVSDGAAVRPQTESERMLDFDTLTHYVKELYGPAEYKERRFGYKIADLFTEYREQMKVAKDDAEAFGVLKSLLSRLQDGHVSLTATTPIGAHTIPIFLSPFEKRAIIAAITDPKLTESHGIEVGDEVAEVDGRPVFDFLPIIRKYEAFGNEISDQHYIARVLKRPFYMKELKPTSATARLKIVKPDGRVLERDFYWTSDAGAFKPTPAKQGVLGIPVLEVAYSDSAAEIIRGTALEFGEETPFFATKQARKELGWTRVQPSPEAMKRNGLKDEQKTPDLFAALYRYEGKMILLMRVAHYAPEDMDERLAWYKSVIQEYGSLADVMVFDQTHNPGGYLSYANDIASLFAGEKMRGASNFLHGDRRWLSNFASALSETAPEADKWAELRKLWTTAFTLVEDAYDRGLSLTKDPVPLGFGFNYIQPASVTFDKPVLMLIDELAGSCGDLVPMIMKENGRATLFGKRTIGLGGNVEQVVQLPSSQAGLRLTRGHFVIYSPEGKYDFTNMVENNGVTPDIEHDVTVADFRAGYTEYVKAFSKAAVSLVETKK